MASPAVLSLRPAIEEDRSKLANLLHFETYVHRHLDWRRPLDWLGKDPYLILEKADRLSAALACPPDPPEVAWVRLFAVITRTDAAEAWSMMWPLAEDELRNLGVQQTAAIPLHDWFRKLLAESHFQHTDNVVVLNWESDVKVEESARKEPQHRIRTMQESDLQGVYDVDRSAFAPLWQNSLEAVKVAFKQAGSATLVEEQGQVAAYQISTEGSQGLHLARLATHPKFQGKGFASALVNELQQVVRQRKDRRLTVNTQENNAPSLSLYKKLGFKLTKEQFPVFELQLN